VLRRTFLNPGLRLDGALDLGSVKGSSDPFSALPYRRAFDLGGRGGRPILPFKFGDARGAAWLGNKMLSLEGRLSDRTTRSCCFVKGEMDAGASTGNGGGG
jgi:hypothetical protein